MLLDEVVKGERGPGVAAASADSSELLSRHDGKRTLERNQVSGRNQHPPQHTGDHRGAT